MDMAYLLDGFRKARNEAQDSDSKEYFDVVLSILSRMNDAVKSDRELFLPIKGNPNTHDGKFFWAWVVEEHHSLTLDKAVKASSDNKMSCTASLGEPPGIHIKKAA